MIFISNFVWNLYELVMYLSGDNEYFNWVILMLLMYNLITLVSSPYPTDAQSNIRQNSVYGVQQLKHIRVHILDSPYITFGIVAHR